MVVVSDTSPIINLAIIGQLDLLPLLFQRVIIPTAVYKEIVQNGAGLPGSTEIQRAAWVEIRHCKDLALIDELMTDLDQGEAEAIALALEFHVDKILMDEELGRKTALQYHLQPLGILGILIRAKTLGLIPAVKPLMDRLISEARFFIHGNLYKSVLQQVNE